MDGGGSRRSRVERGGRLLMGVSCCDPLTSPKSFSIFWPFFFHYFTFTWVILTLKADNTSNQLKREKCCTLFKSALFLTPMISIWQDQRLIPILGLIMCSLFSTLKFCIFIIKLGQYLPFITPRRATSYALIISKVIIESRGSAPFLIRNQ